MVTQFALTYQQAPSGCHSLAARRSPRRLHANSYAPAPYGRKHYRLLALLWSALEPALLVGGCRRSMRPQEGAYLAHHQGNPFLGLLPGE